MTDARERYLQTIIYLLMQEVASLRSVLSEVSDKEKRECFVQWTRAEIMRQAIESEEYKL